MRRFLGGVAAGSAGLLLLGRWLKEKRKKVERRQGWTRVRNVFSPVYISEELVEDEKFFSSMVERFFEREWADGFPGIHPHPSPPPKPCKNTQGMGGGEVSVGVDETPEVRVETGVRLRPDGVVEVLWFSAVDMRTEGCVLDGDFDLGEDDHGLLWEDRACLRGLRHNLIVYDDLLGPTGEVNYGEQG